MCRFLRHLIPRSHCIKLQKEPKVDDAEWYFTFNMTVNHELNNFLEINYVIVRA